MGKANEEVNRRWKNDPEYRKQVVREMEKTGTIIPQSDESFGSLVYGDMDEQPNPEDLEV